jgi:serine/threonine protein phosphatase PrpC
MDTTQKESILTNKMNHMVQTAVPAASVSPKKIEFIPTVSEEIKRVKYVSDTCLSRIKDSSHGTLKCQTYIAGGSKVRSYGDPKWELPEFMKQSLPPDTQWLECGEDHISMVEIVEPEKDIYAIVSQLQDGHGNNGAIASRTFAAAGLPELVKYLPKLKCGIEENDYDSIKDSMTKVFSVKEDKSLTGIMNIDGGGSTDSTVVAMKIDGQWKLVVATVGDSPVICDHLEHSEYDEEKPFVGVVGGNDSWDNEEAYGSYIQLRKKEIKELVEKRWIKNGFAFCSNFRNKMKTLIIEEFKKNIRPAIYGRGNLGLNWKCAGPTGDYRPIEIYERDSDGIPTNKVNRINAEFMSKQPTVQFLNRFGKWQETKMTLGGNQSRSGRYKTVTNTIPTEYQHQNFGSTLYLQDGTGGGQPASTLGDRNDKRLSGVTWKPNVKVIDWGNKPGILIMVSDGLDIFYKSEIYDIAFKAIIQGKDPANAIYNEALEFAKRDTSHGYFVKKIKNKDQQSWDDCSVMVFVFQEEEEIIPPTVPEHLIVFNKTDSVNMDEVD